MDLMQKNPQKDGDDLPDYKEKKILSNHQRLDIKQFKNKKLNFDHSKSVNRYELYKNKDNFYQ